jgi:hypothetical protein
VQLSKKPIPIPVWNVPLGHCKQAARLVIPNPVWYVPAMHPRQTDVPLSNLNGMKPGVQVKVVDDTKTLVNSKQKIKVNVAFLLTTIGF